MSVEENYNAFLKYKADLMRLYFTDVTVLKLDCEFCESNSGLGHSGPSAEFVMILVNINSIGVLTVELEDNMVGIDGAVGVLILSHREGDSCDAGFGIIERIIRKCRQGDLG